MAESLTLPQVRASIHAVLIRLNRASNAGDNWMFYDGDEWEERVLESSLLDAWTILVDLVSRLEHGPLLESAKKKYEKAKENPAESLMGPEEPYFLWVTEAYRLLYMIKDIHDPDEVAECSDPKTIEHLLSIIRNSEYYITSRGAFGWLPCREEDLHRRLEGVIKCAYPDLLTKPHLPKPIKGFAADTGIPSLNTLLEYKFIETEVGGKKALEEILADISGYQCDAYDKFVFVIYETSRFFTEDEWRSAILACKPRNRIEVIIIRGVPPTEDDIAYSKKLQTKRKTPVVKNTTHDMKTKRAKSLSN